MSTTTGTRVRAQSPFSLWANRHRKWVFATPAMVFVALLIAFPLGWTLYLSLTDASGSIRAPHDFIGFGNYLDVLTDTEQSLQHSISTQSAPGALALRARALGMVPNENAAFLRLSDGRILGVAKPAVADPTFTVVIDPSMKKAKTTETKKSTGPTKTVTKKGTVTTTTIVTTKAGGVVETVRTIVDSKTGRTTTTTTVTQPTKKAKAKAKATTTAKPTTTKH